MWTPFRRAGNVVEVQTGGLCVQAGALVQSCRSDDSPERGVGFTWSLTFRKMKQRIMVVEDDTDLRDSLRELLQGEGYEVEECENGMEAIRALVEQGHRPCIILLDLRMPHVNGFEVLKALRSADLSHRAPVFVMTAAADSAVPPGVPVLRKPFDIAGLLELVADHCETGNHAG